MFFSKLRKRLMAFAMTITLLMSGCSDNGASSGESSSSSSSEQSSTTTVSTSNSGELPSISIPAQSYPGASSALENAISSTTTLEIIDKAEPSERQDGDRLTFTKEMVYSGGRYYTIAVSGAPQENAAITDETTYVKDKVYGDFRLDIVEKGKVISELKINVPRDDIFFIMDSAADGFDYGLDILSYYTEYGSTAYPDIIQLDFYRKSDYEVPQYARYFAIIDGEITELDIYENGAVVSPRGTHPKMKSAGLFIQHLCVKNGSGGYTVIQYEYRFDVANKRLNRKQVRFTGYN